MTRGAKTRRGKPWTQREDERLAELVRRRATWGRVATEMGRTQLACRARARQIGLGQPIRRWRPEDDTWLRRMWVAGVPTGVIGERLGCTPFAVITRASRLGLGDCARKTQLAAWRREHGEGLVG